MNTKITANELKQIYQDQTITILDVRKPEAHQDAPQGIPNATYHSPFEIENWMTTLDKKKKTIAYCVHGHEVSQGAASTLRENGFDALYLEGGIENWKDQGNPVE